AGAKRTRAVPTLRSGQRLEMVNGSKRLRFTGRATDEVGALEGHRTGDRAAVDLHGHGAGEDLLRRIVRAVADVEVQRGDGSGHHLVNGRVEGSGTRI